MRSNNSSEFSLGSYLVRNEDGEFDLDLSLAKFEKEATTYIELQGADENRVLETMIGLYAADPTITIDRRGLTTLTLGALNATMKTVGELTKRVDNIIENNPRFYMSRGAGVGFMSPEQLTVFNETGKNPAQIRSEEKAEAKARKEFEAAAKASKASK